MADICCGVVGDQSETISVASSCDHHPRRTTGVRRSRSRMDNNNNLRRFKFVSADVVEVPAADDGKSKRQKLDMIQTPFLLLKSCLDPNSNDQSSDLSSDPAASVVPGAVENGSFDRCPKFGVTSVCGRRRDMEDAVAIHPSFWKEDGQIPARFHFFGVYDGHGCSHVAMSCKDQLHDLVKEELEMIDSQEEEEEESSSSSSVVEWKEIMERSFAEMDKEVLERNGKRSGASCRCELQMPQCDAVGSTAVVSVVTPDKVIVANCGDSRAILCRGGKAVPLSIDHKPDLPDELNRIQEAGGRVIYWDGPRVLGVLAMSRAIGDNYLKPYVSSVPEITVTERSEEDEFLIMASDGLWDVVSNDTACGVVRMCLKGKTPPILQTERSSSPAGKGKDGGKIFGEEKMDKGCSDAAMLLTKLALARRSADNVSVLVVDLRREKKN